ncbi:hypothetical protein RFI_10045 [Reticulomyxa filosa]|uniref:Uncharacterized protein n=1 Tax=Reticulomyxa filosa TaxID=46433 RepID=X6NNY6_RETFI|nr:hypothetical protein RFI_10045 [Reticulomyxa filosa]|eukprot:ETO27087.1 hypothetical protein RFI_10045 [Reticulomyxa filosa]
MLYVILYTNVNGYIHVFCFYKGIAFSKSTWKLSTKVEHCYQCFLLCLSITATVVIILMSIQANCAILVHTLDFNIFFHSDLYHCGGYVNSLFWSFFVLLCSSRKKKKKKNDIRYSSILEDITFILVGLSEMFCSIWISYQYVSKMYKVVISVETENIRETNLYRIEKACVLAVVGATTSVLSIVLIVALPNSIGYLTIPIDMTVGLICLVSVFEFGENLFRKVFGCCLFYAQKHHLLRRATSKSQPCRECGRMAEMSLIKTFSSTNVPPHLCNQCTSRRTLSDPDVSEEE